jgi:hypothetical protein
MENAVCISVLHEAVGRPVATYHLPVQGVFQHVKGVTSAVPGYAGGAAGTAHYEMVGTNTTGHAESVRVTVSAMVVSYWCFFSVAHDPTELNRQGPDIGTQYRSKDCSEDRGVATDQFYGDRTYRARDPEGHVWTFAQTVRHVSREEAEKESGRKIDGWH